MPKVRFLHECHLNAIKQETGSVLDEADLPENWLPGALRYGMVERIPDDVAAAVGIASTPGSAAEAPAKTGVIPADVKAALAAAMN